MQLLDNCAHDRECLAGLFCYPPAASFLAGNLEAGCFVAADFLLDALRFLARRFASDTERLSVQRVTLT